MKRLAACGNFDPDPGQSWWSWLRWSCRRCGLDRDIHWRRWRTAPED